MTINDQPPEQSNNIILVQSIRSCFCHFFIIDSGLRPLGVPQLKKKQ
jgi:hypothetical protein